MQGGLGMPDRDYYISKSPKMAELRKQYQGHVAAILKLAGLSDAQARADRIFALETKIAGVHATRVESEDVHAAQTWEAGGAGQEGAGSRLVHASGGCPLKRCLGLHHLATESRDRTFRLGSQ